MIDGNYLKEPRGIYRDKRNVREDSRERERERQNTVREPRKQRVNRKNNRENSKLEVDINVSMSTVHNITVGIIITYADGY